MTNVPVRGLAQYGVISDASATDIPAAAWTHARNARMVDNRVRRSPGFRTLIDTLLTESPFFVTAASPGSSADYLLYTDTRGRVYQRTTTGSHGEVTAVAHVDTESTSPFTATILGENLVLNRNTEQPWYLDPGGSVMQALPGWDATHTAASVRTYKDFLVALSITKVGVRYQNMVKTSDAALAGQMPQSWDQNDPTLEATENILNELDTGLIDGLQLGDDFILYTSSQVWKMSYRGDDFIFDYRNTGITKGIINANCAVRAAATHLVFGVNDIYQHDGFTDQSIADGRVRDFVFNTIDRSKLDRCFVFNDQRHSTARFCFPSSYTDSYWSLGTQCNMCASYNYEKQVWTFEDMPEVSGCALANPATIYSYDTVPGSYDESTFSFADSDESSFLIPVFVTTQRAGGLSPNISARAYVHDLVAEGAQHGGLPLDSDITPPVVLQKTMADLDDLGVSLRAYKVIKSVIPQIDAVDTLQVRFGSQMRLRDAVSWDPYFDFDPEVDEVVDAMNPDTGLFPGGRLVSIEFLYEDTDSDLTFTAYDVELTTTFHR